MTTATEVATKLRSLADALDKVPELKLIPYMSLTPAYGEDEKNTFLALAKVFPRPIKKTTSNNGTTYEDYVLQNDFMRVSIGRSKICVLVKEAVPAVYECPSILSETEEAALGEF